METLNVVQVDKQNHIMLYLSSYKIRLYCWQDLAAYIDTPEKRAMLQVSMRLAGGQIGEIQHEQESALNLFQCIDLTPREQAAAGLLAVISNHRAITWQREPRPPSGNKSASPLEQAELEALAKQTNVAVTEYSAFLPEREAAMLLACALTNATPAVEQSPPVDGEEAQSGDNAIPGKMPRTAIGKFAVKAACQIERTTGKRATARQVIEKLQEWEKDEPILTGAMPHGVKWVTSKGTEKPFDVQTCAKALETWNASRA